MKLWAFAVLQLCVLTPLRDVKWRKVSDAVIGTPERVGGANATDLCMRQSMVDA